MNIDEMIYLESVQEEEREKRMTEKEKLQEKLDSYTRIERNLSNAIKDIKKELEKL